MGEQSGNDFQAVMSHLKVTLYGLLVAGVIARVTEKKNESVCVRLDPSGTSISRPITEDVLRKLACKKFFSILDEKDGE